MTSASWGNWEALYERYAPVVYQRALAFVRNEEDAWDVTHEVFRRVFESRPTLRFTLRPMTYLYQATTHACLNWLRARRTRRSVPVDVAGHGPVAPEDGADARDALVVLAEHLGDQELHIAALHFVDGLNQEEIAPVVHLSRKTVGRKLAEVRQAARQLCGMDLETSP